MSCIVLLLALTFVCGCSPSDNASKQDVPSTESDADPSQQVSAFEFDQAAGVISLNTQIPPRQRRRFDIGQGSVTLETVDIKDNRLTFHYTPEIEGGYTVYECTLPVSPMPITIKVNTDGTPGETSFDLTKCRIVKTGNVHWE